MVMVKVPLGTRRLPRTNESPPTEWTILLEPSAHPGFPYGMRGEVEIGFTQRLNRGWRAFPIGSAGWQDFTTPQRWVDAVAWLVEAYKSYLNTMEPAEAGENQQVVQQHQATLSGSGHRRPIRTAREGVEPLSQEAMQEVLDAASQAVRETPEDIDLSWLDEQAQPAPDKDPLPEEE